MVGPKELRIGNIINFGDGTIGPFTVSSINARADTVKRVTLAGDIYFGYETWKTIDIDCDKLTPIPIAPEWLERFGCSSIKVDAITIYEIWCNGFVISFDENMQCEIETEKTDDDKDFVPMPHIKHVHQVQNLIFALTGEELTVKEK